MNWNASWLLLILLTGSLSAGCQSSKTTAAGTPVCIGFYNLENLFDTIVDPDTSLILRDEFTPRAEKKYNSERYYQKLSNMARVIADMAKTETPDGPAIIGVCEVENRRVLDDLVKMPAIASRKYSIVHFDSPDERGIDVALLYQEKYFKPAKSSTHSVIDPSDKSFHTRDQLLVSGKLNGEDFHFMVAHWPSRRGGEAKSQPMRMLAAKTAAHLMDSLHKVDPKAKMIYMGDLNDDPINASIVDIIKPVSVAEQAQSGGYYNPMRKLFDDGKGTLSYKGKWNLFDQFICSSALVMPQVSGLHFTEARIMKSEYLLNPPGEYEGQPLRTYAGTKWLNGYSDHLPVYLLLSKK
jgi:hypothetical protein